MIIVESLIVIGLVCAFIFYVILLFCLIGDYILMLRDVVFYLFNMIETNEKRRLSRHYPSARKL